MWVEITHPDSPTGGAWATKRLDVDVKLPAGADEAVGQLRHSSAFHDAVADLEQQLAADVERIAPAPDDGSWR
jgi:hypothetical protein